MLDMGEKHLAATSFIISNMEKTIKEEIILVCEIPSFNRSMG